MLSLTLPSPQVRPGAVIVVAAHTQSVPTRYQPVWLLSRTRPARQARAGSTRTEQSRAALEPTDKLPPLLDTVPAPAAELVAAPGSALGRLLPGLAGRSVCCGVVASAAAAPRL